MWSIITSGGPISLAWRRLRVFVILILVTYLLDLYLHLKAFKVPSPSISLDTSFAHNCKPSDHNIPDDFNVHDASLVPLDVSEPRENAAIIVLARNSDIEGMTSSVQSLEQQWNKWYHYPYVFLNDQPWEEEFKAAMAKVTTSNLTFAQIPKAMWSWPQNPDGSPQVDREIAKANWERMAKAGLPYVTAESYHHMCRFYSGFFYDHPAVAPYKYYWRLEPDVSFTCRIPYDPFRAMRLHKKVYGWTMALWEVGSTCPSLFRAIADYKEAAGLATTSLWTSLIDASWAPFPLRHLFMSVARLFHSRNRQGDGWNHCHFWSNFEIGDLDFFRSEGYRSFFAALDKTGGFFLERWGDAPIHTLGLAILARPEQVHYFEDIGYAHGILQHVPPGSSGCDCKPDPDARIVDGYCKNKLQSGVSDPKSLMPG